ncbi:MAG: methyltransferase domain-containing protein [Verrucomicrobia bacterium]|nr:methyltransferase domain-containing protein [Verrucomicrobiota bacterium]
MKLHIGCGECILPGWMNLDLEPMPGVDLIDDIRRLEKITDESCEIVYASYCLEHVGWHEIEDVLRLWGRKLKSGGVLRLSVPDFAQVCRYYLTSEKISDVIEAVVGAQRTSYDYHGMIFDHPLLTHYLKTAGFQDIRLWDPRQTDHAAYKDKSSSPFSLNIEAIQP